MRFKLRDVEQSETLDYTTVALYYFDSLSDLDEKVSELKIEQNVGRAKVIDKGDINQLKDACIRYPLLASETTCDSILLLENITSYKLYNSYMLRAQRRIYASTHNKEESFNSMLDILGEFKYGVIAYE